MCSVHNPPGTVCIYFCDLAVLEANSAVYDMGMFCQGFTLKYTASVNLCKLDRDYTENECVYIF